MLFPPPFLVGQTNSRDKRPGKNQSRRRRQQDIIRSIGVTVCRIFMKNYYPKTKMEPKNGGGWKMTFLFKQVIFRFHVSFREVESFRYVVSKSKRGSTAKKDDTFSRSFHENAAHNLIGAFNMFFLGTYVKHVFFLLLEIQVVNQIVSSFQSVVVFLGVSKKVKYTPQNEHFAAAETQKGNTHLPVSQCFRYEVLVSGRWCVVIFVTCNLMFIQILPSVPLLVTLTLLFTTSFLLLHPFRY